MKKEELKEFIEGTIIPNKIKGITATMLKEVLLEVADSLGEGGEGGGGGYAIFCNFDNNVLNSDDYKDNPAAGIAASNLLTPEQLEHNKQCFEKIIAEINSGKPMPLINIDCNPKTLTNDLASWDDMHMFGPIMMGYLINNVNGDGFEGVLQVEYPYIAGLFTNAEIIFTKEGYVTALI